MNTGSRRRNLVYVSMGMAIGIAIGIVISDAIEYGREAWRRSLVSSHTTCMAPWPPGLTYRFYRGSHQKDKTDIWESELTLSVRNNSASPAKDVWALIDILSEDATVTCSAEYSIGYMRGTARLIHVLVVPAYKESL